MWERGEKMPSQLPNTLMRCPCGETFDSHRVEHTLIHVNASTGTRAPLMSPRRSTGPRLETSILAHSP
jgi:hypothetical protein